MRQVSTTPGRQLTSRAPLIGWLGDNLSLRLFLEQTWQQVNVDLE